jgi:lipoprotein-anchoring transpeptidase ErfK/SrfK
MALEPIPKILVVDRDAFSLKLYERPENSYEFEVAVKFPVAVGAKGFQTPRGLYLINTKAKNPDWQMPNSEWVPKELRGTIVPGGAPNNPIKSRWLGITNPIDGVGIHGTADDASIGSAASHGCVRMHIPDVIELFDLVPKYTPIYIA